MGYLLIIAYSLLAVASVVLTVYLSQTVKFGEETDYNQQLWTYFCVLLYSIFVTVLQQYYSSAAEYVTKLENHSRDLEYESSLTSKSFLMSASISYAGLLAYAYWVRNFGLLNLLMIFLQILSKIVLNLIEAAKPYKKFPKLFRAHEKGFKPHCRRNPEDYEQFSNRIVHFDAEK